MGVSVLTALSIQSNPDDLEIVVARQDPARVAGKWAAAVWLKRGDELHSLLLSTEPVYESEEEARSAMEDVIKEVKGLNMFEEARRVGHAGVDMAKPEE